MTSIDYTDDPRAALCHFNEKHDNLGRFAKKSGGGVKKKDPFRNPIIKLVPKNDANDTNTDTAKESKKTWSSHKKESVFHLPTERENRELSSEVRTSMQNALVRNGFEDYLLKNNFLHDGIDYSGDPRAVLIHENPYHDPKTGQFTSGPFGMSRYVKNGKLTEEGKRRLAHDKKRNAQKKKDDQVKDKDGMTVDEILTDPHRWVKEDLSEIESGLKAAGTLTGDVSKFLKSQEAKRPAVRKKRLKLKDMTDAELQAQINRYLLEQRYEDIFNPKEPPEVSKGKKFLMNTLEVTGGVLAVGASAVTIAKALHELKKGS